LTQADVEVEGARAIGWVIVEVTADVQPLASVTVKLYVAAVREKMPVPV